MKVEFLKLDDEQMNSFCTMQDSSKKMFLDLTSKEKDDVMELKPESRDAYIVRYSELDRDEKSYLKTMDTI